MPRLQPPNTVQRTLFRNNKSAQLIRPPLSPLPTKIQPHFIDPHKRAPNTCTSFKPTILSHGIVLDDRKKWRSRAPDTFRARRLKPIVVQCQCSPVQFDGRTGGAGRKKVFFWQQTLYTAPLPRISQKIEHCLPEARMGTRRRRRRRSLGCNPLGFGGEHHFPMY